MRLAAVILALLALPASASARLRIEVTSNRADLVSGGNAVVVISGARKARVRLGRRNVTKQFARRPDGRFGAVLRGLRNGRNVLTARAGKRGARLVITNHPNGGPVFSGPQVQPWRCQKTAVNAKCDEPPKFAFFYKSTDATQTELLPYDPKSPPSDVATTTTDGGVTVPFVVRRETGYQDRDRYRIETLFDPAASWDRWQPQKQFNHKLLLVHGGSCHTSYEPKNPPWGNGGLTGTPGSEDITIVAAGRGYAVASTTLDNSGANCNVALQAESIMMAKEHIAETYGDIRYTVGEGCSGGSLAEQWMSNAYPGLYDGLIATCTFPDADSTAQQIFDYALLAYYFGVPINETPNQPADVILGETLPQRGWTTAQVAEVAGDGTANAPVSFNWAFSAYNYFALADPTTCSGPASDVRYDRKTRPAGVRCGVLDWQINLLGPRSKSVWSAQERAAGHGFAGVPVDNVGIQYGLAALADGTISAQQFVDLNSAIGGADPDLLPQAPRLLADGPALGRAYRTGLINDTSNLDRVPIINLAGPNDPGLAHDSYRAFAIRARLDREHGTHANQVMWQGPAPIVGDFAMLNSGALAALDRWLLAIEKDDSEKTLAQKVIADKPADIVDACFDGDGVKVHDDLCGTTVVPVYGTPRTVAGEPITTDQNKCVLQPLNRAKLPVTVTDAQWVSLRKTFASGVCDWSKPGIDQRSVVPWLKYGDRKGRVIYGGRPLGRPPRSTRLRTRR